MGMNGTQQNGISKEREKPYQPSKAQNLQHLFTGEVSSILEVAANYNKLLTKYMQEILDMKKHQIENTMV